MFNLFGQKSKPSAIRDESLIISADSKPKHYVFQISLISNSSKATSSFAKSVIERLPSYSRDSSTIGYAFFRADTSFGEAPVRLHFHSYSSNPYYWRQERSRHRDSKAIVFLLKLSELDAVKIFEDWYRDLKEDFYGKPIIYIDFISEPASEMITDNLSKIEALVERLADNRLRIFRPFNASDSLSIHDLPDFLREITNRICTDENSSHSGFSVRDESAGVVSPQRVAQASLPASANGGAGREDAPTLADSTVVPAVAANRAVSPAKVARSASARPVATQAPANGGAGRAASAAPRLPAMSPITAPAQIRATSPSSQRATLGGMPEPAQLSIAAQFCRAVSPPRGRPVDDSRTIVEHSAAVVRQIPEVEGWLTTELPSTELTYQDFWRSMNDDPITINLPYKHLAKSRNILTAKYYANGACELSSHESRDFTLYQFRLDGGKARPQLSFYGKNFYDIFRRYLHATASLPIDEIETADPKDYQQQSQDALVDFLGANSELFIRALQLFQQELLHITVSPIKRYLQDYVSTLLCKVGINFTIQDGNIIAHATAYIWGLDKGGENILYPLNLKIESNSKFLRGETLEQDKWVVESLTLIGPDANLAHQILLGQAPEGLLTGAPNPARVKWGMVNAAYQMTKDYITHSGSVAVGINDICFDATEDEPVIPKLPHVVYCKLGVYGAPLSSYAKACGHNSRILESLLQLYIYKLIANPFTRVQAEQLAQILARLEPTLGDQLDAIFTDKTTEQIKQALIIKIKCLDELYTLLQTTDDLGKCFMKKCMQAIDISEEKFWLVLEMAYLYREVYEYTEPSYSQMLQCLSVFEIERLRPESSILSSLISKKIEKEVIGHIPYGIYHILLWEGSYNNGGAHRNYLEVASSFPGDLALRGSRGAAGGAHHHAVVGSFVDQSARPGVEEPAIAP